MYCFATICVVAILARRGLPRIPNIHIEFFGCITTAAIEADGRVDVVLLLAPCRRGRQETTNRDPDGIDPYFFHQGVWRPSEHPRRQRNKGLLHLTTSQQVEIVAFSGGSDCPL